MGVTSLGRHLRPACNLDYCRDLFLLNHQKKYEFWPQYSVFFIDFRWCEGSGDSFECLRMRSRSMRKCAHMNAGTWGVFWRSAHVPTIPFTWLRRAKALGRTVHASYLHACMCLPMNACVLYPMPGIPLADWSKWVTWTQVRTFQC